MNADGTQTSAGMSSRRMTWKKMFGFFFFFKIEALWKFWIWSPLSYRNYEWIVPISILALTT